MNSCVVYRTRQCTCTIKEDSPPLDESPLVLTLGLRRRRLRLVNRESLRISSLVNAAWK